MDFEQWGNFKDGTWKTKIDVRDFIKQNYTPYEGDESFLSGPTERTNKLWNDVLNLYKKEMENGGILDADTKTPSAINAYDAGYIDKDLTIINTMINTKTGINNNNNFLFPTIFSS